MTWHFTQVTSIARFIDTITRSNFLFLKGFVVQFNDAEASLKKKMVHREILTYSSLFVCFMFIELTGYMLTHDTPNIVASNHAGQAPAWLHILRKQDSLRKGYV